MINLGESITAIVFLIFALLVLFKGVRMVPQGFNWTIERFGKYTRTLNPGLHILRKT
jgi:regulator of protease activity HflC (stomatin/prohibitin superfamily)